jgi:hypothetical protein
MANHMPSTHSSKQFYQFQSVYPNLDAKGNIASYRVIMDGKIADVPASGAGPSPSSLSPASPRPEANSYQPSPKELTSLQQQQYSCWKDLEAINMTCLHAQHTIDKNTGAAMVYSWDLGGHVKSELSAAKKQPKDGYTGALGKLALDAYKSLEARSDVGSPDSPAFVLNDPSGNYSNYFDQHHKPIAQKARQEAGQLLSNLLRNEYFLATCPELVNEIQTLAAAEAKHFEQRSPRVQAVLGQAYPLGMNRIAAPLRQEEAQQILKFKNAAASLSSAAPPAEPASEPDKAWLVQAAQVRNLAFNSPAIAGKGVNHSAPLSYPPAGPGIGKYGEKLQESKSTPKILPVQIVGEPEYSSLAVDSSRGFVRRVAEENGRKMVALKEVDGTIQVSQEARYRFDRTFGRPFDQESAKDKYGMLQLIANGGETDPKLVNTAWQKMSDSQKEVIAELKMDTPSTGTGMAIKSDAYSKFREAHGREFDPQSGLDKINLANISSGKPQMSLEEWARNPAEPVQSAIPTVEVFSPTTPEPQDPEPTPAKNAPEAPSIMEATPAAKEAEVSQEKPKQAKDQEENQEEPDPNQNELDEDERRKRANAGQAIGDYMDTSVDIF